MAKRDVKGLHRVVSKDREYWYIGRERGAPRVHGAYGTPDFWASFDAVNRERHIPEPGKFRALVMFYKASAVYQKTAASTKKQWGPWLDRIAEYFGVLPIAAFDHPRIRLSIRKWRNTYAATPRGADMGMQVLSVVCAYGVELGKLAFNPCEGIKALYTSDRAEIIWTDADIALIKKFTSPEVGHAVDLGATTGLRRGDLQRLSWSHIQGDAIVIATGKSKHRQQAVIPIYDGLRVVLDRIPKRSTTILTNSFGRPWTDVGLGNAIMRAKAKAGIGDLHFHDLRGTAATRFYIAGLSERVIAEIMGWTEESVGRIIRRYVERGAATRAVITQLNKRPS